MKIIHDTTEHSIMRKVDELLVLIIADLRSYSKTLISEADKVHFKEKYGNDSYYNLIEKGIFGRMKDSAELHLDSLKAVDDAQSIIDDMEPI